ncbi:MAG: hypothetical protein JO332_10435 [Planctomycetaceae bacterium]|nr:hypothetical protein [Planctomycetaceae bacterium]
MTTEDKQLRRPPWILIGVGIVLVLGLAGFLLVPSETCPECHGFTIAHNEHTVRGLPDPESGATPCKRCVGRGKVSRLSLWASDDVNGD